MPKDNNTKTNKYTYGIAIGSSISLWKPYLFGGSIEEGIRVAKKWGYSAVELHHIADPKEADTGKILKYSKKYGIEISAISTGPAYYFDKLSLTHDSKEVRDKAIERLREYIDLASIVGGLITIGTMRGNIPDICWFKTYKKRLFFSLKEVSPYAEDKKVTLLLEVANRYEINYLNRVGEIYDFITCYNTPALKIHMDTFHMNIEEVNICKVIKDYGNLLGYFHVADSNRYFPGAGHIDFSSIASAISDIGYEGYIIVECLPLPSGDIAAKKALNYLKKIF